MANRPNRPPFKPSLAFLRKVAAGEVMKVSGYLKPRGPYRRFIGGEGVARQHAAAGYINMPGVAEPGEHAEATLTDAGRAALGRRS